MSWAVFLDRDGTVNEEVHYLHEPERLHLLPGSPEAIRVLNDAGIPAILITNQAGIGRGHFAESAMHAVHEELGRQLAAHGAHLDAVYFCPHQPNDGCTCRKPLPGLLIRAALDMDLDLPGCVMVGDKVSDLAAGWSAGCRTALVLSGYGAEAQSELTDAERAPDFVGSDLLEVVRWVLSDCAQQT
jgi:D-glycero-D-manno-heptose 1,7-bisphosphate phosphatase